MDLNKIVIIWFISINDNQNTIQVIWLVSITCTVKKYFEEKNARMNRCLWFKYLPKTGIAGGSTIQSLYKQFQYGPDVLAVEQGPKFQNYRWSSPDKKAVEC